MGRVWTLLGFVGLVFGLGALLAVPLYRVMIWAGWGEAIPFERVVSRALLIVAVIAAWPLARVLRANGRNLGLTRPIRRDIILGAMLGLMSLGSVVLLELAFDAREIRSSLDCGKLYRSLFLAFGAAAFVAPLEEILFRGVCFGLTRGRKWVPAMVFSSLLFAFVHFLQTPRSTTPVEMNWSAGFTVLRSMFAQNVSGAIAAAQFVNLALCGAILCVAFQRTGTLWFSMALHAAWIFWLKLANTITTVSQPSATWGTRKVMDAWAVSPLLLATLVAAICLTRRSTIAPDESTEFSSPSQTNRQNGRTQ